MSRVGITSTSILSQICHVTLKVAKAVVMVPSIGNVCSKKVNSKVGMCFRT